MCLGVRVWFGFNLLATASAILAVSWQLWSADERCGGVDVAAQKVRLHTDVGVSENERAPLSANLFESPYRIMTY